MAIKRHYKQLINQQIGDGPNSRAVTFIFRNKSGRIIGVDDGVCLASLKYDKSTKKVAFIDIIHNQKFPASLNDHSYRSPSSVRYLHHKTGHIICKKWHPSYARRVISILSKSKRWGKYFDKESKDCILRWSTRYDYYLRINPRKISYTLLLFLYGWYRFICEARNYGFALIQWDLWNQKRPVEEQLTVDQLIVIANRYYFNSKGPDQLWSNNSLGGGHRNFNGCHVNNALGVYDNYVDKIIRSRKLNSDGPFYSPANIMNIGAGSNPPNTLAKLITLTQDNLK